MPMQEELSAKATETKLKYNRKSVVFLSKACRFFRLNTLQVFVFNNSIKFGRILMLLYRIYKIIYAQFEIIYKHLILVINN